MRKQTVLVTGGTSGIGLSIAIYLRHLGHTVYATSRNPERYDLKGLEQTFIMQNNFKVPKKMLTKIETILSEIKFIKLDITANQSIDELVDIIETEADMIDILINNVGFSSFSSIEEIDFDLVKSMFDTNIVGPIYLIQKVFPKMREKKNGRLINITSMSSYQALPYMGIYAAIKTHKVIMKKNPKINYQSSRVREAFLNSLRKIGSTQFFMKILGWYFRS